MAGSDADCAGSKDCRQWGLCTFARHQACVAATPEDCARSEKCAELGRCTLSHGSCGIGSSADCRQSARCDDEGLCQKSERGCVKSCSDEPECWSHGRCSDGPLGCIATAAADCAKSVGCRDEGRCSPRDGHCAAVTLSDCRNVSLCKAYGCFVFEGACRPRHACACDFSSGVYSGEEDLRRRAARAAACHRAAGQLPSGMCQPKP